MSFSEIKNADEYLITEKEKVKGQIQETMLIYNFKKIFIPNKDQNRGLNDDIAKNTEPPNE